MAVKNFNFTIDTIKENYSIVANVKQLDNVVLNITVTENNQLKDLTNQTLKLFVRRHDSSLLVQTDNITVTDAKNGKISIAVMNGAFSKAGLTVAELDIEDTTGEIATSTFSINVLEKVGNADAIKNNVDVDFFKQVTDLVATATKEIEQYKAYFDKFSQAGVSIEALDDIKSYVDNSLTDLKTESDNANTLNTTLKSTISDSTTAKDDLQTVINNSTTAKLNLQKVVDDSSTTTSDIQTALTNAKSDINSTVSTAKSDIDSTVTSAKSDIESAITNAKQTINGDYVTTSTFNTTISDTKTAIESDIAQTKSDIESDITTNISQAKSDISKDVDDKISKTKSDIENDISTNISQAKSDISSTIDSKIAQAKTDMDNAIDDKISSSTGSVPSNIHMGDFGLSLEDDGQARNFMTKRTVNDELGVAQLTVDNEYNNPILALQYFCNNTQYLTFEMLKTGEFKCKDNTDNGNSVLVFTNNNGDSSGKGWIGKYSTRDHFTVKSNSGDLILANDYSSNVAVGAGGYLYPLKDNDWALGKSGYRWSNLYTKNITNSSDKNLKENIEYINEVATSKDDTSITSKDLYEFVKDMKLATYDFKNKGNEEQANQGKLGFIAQDFENSAVGESILLKNQEDGMLAYDLNNYINVMVGALQQAIKEIESLKQIIQMLTMSSVKAQMQGTQLTNMMLQNLQMQQRITALENKLNNINK